MKEILIDKSLNFYKANLHCHTTLSDGKHTREEVKEDYKAKGYSVVAFTDHEFVVNNSDLNDENFLAITSTELAIKEDSKQSTLKNLKMKVCHLNFYSPTPDNTITPCYSSIYNHYVREDTKDLVKFDKEWKRAHTTRGINKMIREGNKKGYLVSFNHPSWSLETERDYIGLEGVWAVELYNHSVVNGGGRGDEHVFEEMLRAGKKVYCTAADDNHGENDRFGGFTVINAEKLDYDTIFNALRYGYFYASTGPQIKSLVYEDNKVTFECSDCVKVSLVTEGRRRSAIQADNINSGEFEVKDNDGYFRLVFRDKSGNLAWSQAYDLEELGVNREGI